MDREYYEDQELTCADCGETFTHTGGEQAFMREKFGDDYKPPRRCKPCRGKRKEERAQQHHSQR